MAVVEDLIDFDLIETQKENIQSLPSGRSAKSLASIFSPVAAKSTPSHTQNLNDALRAEYEKELVAIDDSDDPLDVYDRYVKWTLNAYPSAQATPQSQLLPLLERATKAFLSSTHYRNDPRYLRIWLHYIRFFSDAPRENFAYLARHGIGDGLALYYEEFAAWLESSGRWNQAEEIYKLGIEKEARPIERLMRKFGEFEKRLQNRADDQSGPRSPALPTVRAALAAKFDPFSSTSPVAVDPQAAGRSQSTSTSKKQKLEIFSDADDGPQPALNASAKGWDTIGSLAERKKENTVGARPWVGEKIKSSTPAYVGPKMAIFRDENMPPSSIQAPLPNHPSCDQKIMNAKTGRMEKISVNLEAVYPNPEDPTEEYCFEELRAARRGWLQCDWTIQKPEEISTVTQSETTTLIVLEDDVSERRTSHHEDVVVPLQTMIPLSDENGEHNGVSQAAHDEMELARRMRREERQNRTRKIKVKENRGETQTIQTNLSSPKGPRMKRKKEATVTIHTKAAEDEIYEIFGQPLKSGDESDEASEGEESSDDDDYTSAGESTCTGRISGRSSEYGDETQGDLTDSRSEQSEGEGEDDGEEEDEDVEAVREGEGSEATENNTAWTEFDPAQDMPKQGQDYADDENATEELSESLQNDGPRTSEESIDESSAEEVVTPISYTPVNSEPITRFIPLPPDDIEVPTKPYRDAAQVAQSRLPFMTPIVEKTESSLGTAPGSRDNDYFDSKTPCPRQQRTPQTLAVTGELLSSPFADESSERVETPIAAPPTPPKAKGRTKPIALQMPEKKGHASMKEQALKGPIIKDAQCNPMDPNLHKVILDAIQPPLSSHEGFFDHEGIYSQRHEIKKFCKAVAAAKRKSGEKGQLPQDTLVLDFDGTSRQCTFKRELGKGAFAPVYLIEREKDSNSDDEDIVPQRPGRGQFSYSRNPMEAVKLESDPPSAWEFYILSIARRRLGITRAADSIIRVYEMHRFEDETYLCEEYKNQGTLLDMVNTLNVQTKSNMEEIVVMFFTIELLRTLEALHGKGIIHGDLKADNVLVRLDTPLDSHSTDLSSSYQPDGSHGWDNKGISLIDFGRGIDMRVFRPDVQFIADWKTSDTDCAEMRDLRPWTYQADYHGLAAIVHTMLFGKYIETIANKSTAAALGAGSAKTYRLRENLKRYWQVELWGRLFDLLLNPLRHVEAEEGAKLPVLKGLREVRGAMEGWLSENSEKGVGLKAWVRKMEVLAAERRKRD